MAGNHRQKEDCFSLHGETLPTSSLQPQFPIDEEKIQCLDKRVGVMLLQFVLAKTGIIYLFSLIQTNYQIEEKKY